MSANIRFLFVFFAISICRVPAFSKIVSDSITFQYETLPAFHYLYNNEFLKADSIKNFLVKNNSSSPSVSFYEVNFYWWKILTGEDSQETRKKFFAAIIHEKKLLDKTPKPMSYENLFNYINVYAYRSRMDLLNNNYIAAVSHVDKCLDYLKLSFQYENKYEAFYLTSGLYNYFISRARSNYPFLFPYLVFLPKSDRAKGFQYLIKCTTLDNLVLKTEAHYFLMKINYEEEKNYAKAKPHAEWLVAHHPKNILYNYLFLKILISLNDKKAAEKQFENLVIKATQNNELSEKQKNYFLNLAKADMEQFYKKLASERK